MDQTRHDAHFVLPRKAICKVFVAEFNLAIDAIIRYGVALGGGIQSSFKRSCNFQFECAIVAFGTKNNLLLKTELAIIITTPKHPQEKLEHWVVFHFDVELSGQVVGPFQGSKHGILPDVVRRTFN